MEKKYKFVYGMLFALMLIGFVGALNIDIDLSAKHQAKMEEYMTENNMTSDDFGEQAITEKITNIENNELSDDRTEIENKLYREFKNWNQTQRQEFKNSFTQINNGLSCDSWS
jgi:hypothetical protein